jgi:hypothetical protein
VISCAERSPREAILLECRVHAPPAKDGLAAHRNELAYQAIGFMGQAGYSEEADGALPLCATTWGDDKLLRAALAGRRGGPPPAHGWRGRTRLMAACHFGHLPRASLLLSNGAPLEQRDAFGGTAMAAAVVAGRSAVVSALRSAGAGPYTPLTVTSFDSMEEATGAKGVIIIAVSCIALGLGAAASALATLGEFATMGVEK